MAEVSSAWVRPKVLVWGGNGLAQDCVEILRPGLQHMGQFSIGADILTLLAASAVINGRLCVCGGEQADTQDLSQRHSTVSIHCWASGRPCRRCCRDGHGHSAAVSWRSAVCLRWRCAVFVLRLGSAEVFDTVSCTWQSLPVMVHPRCWAGVAVIRNNVYMVGGDGSRNFFGALATHRKLGGGCLRMNEARMRLFQLQSSPRGSTFVVGWAGLHWIDSTLELVSGSCFSQCFAVRARASGRRLARPALHVWWSEQRRGGTVFCGAL